MIEIDRLTDEELRELSVHAEEEKAMGNIVACPIKTDDGLIFDSLDNICRLEVERRGLRS